MRQRLNKLFKKVKLEVKRTKKIADLTHKDSIGVTAAATASPSMSGDRYHAEEQARLNQQKLKQLMIFEKELAEATKEKVPEKIEPICFFKLNQDGENKEYFFVKIPINISGSSFISTESPLGKKLLRKKKGEKTELGEIVEIE